MLDHRPKRGFTLVELLTAVTVLILLLGLILAITTSVSKSLLRTSTKIDAFAAGRAAFDLMSQKLSQATLNTYWDYDNPLAPTVYYRQSDLQFLVRSNVQNAAYGQEVYFQTPATYSANSLIRSTDGLLNACGYFVTYGPDTSFKPTTLTTPAKYRYRLMQGLEPTENLATFGGWPALPVAGSVSSAWTLYWTGSTSGTWTSGTANTWPNFWATHAWINNTIGNPGTGQPNTNDTPLSNNIVAMVVWPRLSTSDDSTGTKLTSIVGNYSYDSQYKALSIDATTHAQPLTANQLPPTVQVTMVLISEASAIRLCTSATPPTVIENALKNGGAARFIDPTLYQSDLSAVESALAAGHIDFQVLNTSVAIRDSKWSDASQ